MFTASLPRSLRAIAPKQLWVCPQCRLKAKPRHSALTAPGSSSARSIRAFHSSIVRADVVPFRKQLKDEAKQKRLGGDGQTEKKRRKEKDPRLERWELTVGIEIHAQLNTERKLFSGEITLLHAGLPQTADHVKERQRPSTIHLTPMSRCSTSLSPEASQ